MLKGVNIMTDENLIDAAPDMYEALELFEAYIDLEDAAEDEFSDEEFMKLLNTYTNARYKMYKALSKARGEYTLKGQRRTA
jgi:hypothetical protein